MSLFNFISISAFIFTIILFFMNKKIGKTYIYFGVPTLILVLMYGYLPVINPIMNGIPIFLLFSLMIMLFSVLLGLTTYLVIKKEKLSIVVSVVVSILMILLLFNYKGMISYMYIPVLLVKVQEFMNGTIILSKKASI